MVHHLPLEREGKRKERRKWRERETSRQHSGGLKSPISCVKSHPVFNLQSWIHVLPANHQLRALTVLRSWESLVLIFLILFFFYCRYTNYTKGNWKMDSANQRSFTALTPWQLLPVHKIMLVWALLFLVCSPAPLLLSTSCGDVYSLCSRLNLSDLSLNPPSLVPRDHVFTVQGTH